MRVAIAGAGSVGRSIAKELISSGNSVLLIDRESRKLKESSVPGAEWLEADACELASLEEAALQSYDVMIAATGDDKVNLVVSLLAKTEFAVSRVVARINHPANEWMFTESWGVDVAVSTPRLLAALVAILRGPRVLVPSPDDPLEAGDELMFLANEDVEDQIHDAVSGPTPASD